MLMDSGSSISLITKRLKDFTQRPLPQIKLKTASHNCAITSMYPEYECPSGAQFCSS